MDFEAVKRFFTGFSGNDAAEIIALPPSGSARQNFSVSSAGQNYIITFNGNTRENEAFFYWSEVFGAAELNTPKVLKISEDRKLYLQQNVGEKTLSEIIAEEGTSDRVKKLIFKTLENLCKLQKATEGNFDRSKTFEYEQYDRLPVLHDLFYFKNYFADVLETEYHRGKLLQEFFDLAEIIENLNPKGVMLRDFQARNILVNSRDEVFFIDYQSAMEGPLLYDVVSMLFQAKANLSETDKNVFLEFYLGLQEDQITRENLRRSLPYLQLMRFLQVLGAYGFRGLIQRKPHFIASIPQGVLNLGTFYKNWDQKNRFPQLQHIIQQLESAEIQQKIKKLTHGT